MENIKFVEILLIEDNPGDARLTQEALNDGKVKNNLHIVYDGIEATDFLFKRNKYKDAPRPDLIILDLNLPKKNGHEVLAEIKAYETLKSIPVVILTTSKAEEDILKSYKSHANCFLTKPIDLIEFFEMIKSIEGFWLTLVKLPTL
ncbi:MULTISPECIES: response regulator [unclassified Flavobacterium]|jgi:two-component system response regulator|uniref:response regulator n=1 Tax=unclassified Flavobacterium TaxID=196869 RepID=UPI0025C615A7|nr:MULTISPECIES: response regulator [unclassified Flavobacterium]